MFGNGRIGLNLHSSKIDSLGKDLDSSEMFTHGLTHYYKMPHFDILKIYN